MQSCETCGNSYEKCFQVVMNGVTHTFDSFECAIFSLAPACSHCGVRIVGHGVEARNEMFCCAHCAHQVGITELQDRGTDAAAS